MTINTIVFQGNHLKNIIAYHLSEKQPGVYGWTEATE